MILPILSAILGIISFSPLNLYPLGFIFLVPLFIFYAKEKSLWRLVIGTILFKGLFLLGTVYYTLEPINWTWIILLSTGLPLCIYGIKKHGKAGYLEVAIPLLFALFDHIKAQYALVPTYIITAGNVLGSSPFVGASKPFGIISLTIFVAIVNGLLAAAYVATGRKRMMRIVLAGVCVAIALFYSQTQLTKTSQRSDDRLITIATIATDKKFSLSDAYALEQDLAKRKVDLIILPESMLDESTIKDPLRWYQGVAKTMNTPVIATMQREQGEYQFVSSIAIKADGSISGVHDKNRLTFMGEFWPFKSWRPFFIDWIATNDPQIKSYAIFHPDHPYKAGSRNLLTIKVRDTSIQIASLICMEVHYPYDLMEYRAKGAQMIITPTSNRWLDSGSAQFRYLTNNLRTIESVWTGMPLIISGINDEAGAITPNGKAKAFTANKEVSPYSISISTISF